MKKGKIAELLDSTFVKITGQMTELCMNKCENPELAPEAFYQIEMKASGAMDADACFFINKELAEELLTQMNHGVPLTEDEREEYLKEYVNIVFGRMISEVSDYLGSGSRFFPPVMGPMQEQAKATDRYQDELSFWYSMEQRSLGFNIAYTLNEQ